MLIMHREASQRSASVMLHAADLSHRGSINWPRKDDTPYIIKIHRPIVDQIHCVTNITYLIAGPCSLPLDGCWRPDHRDCPDQWARAVRLLPSTGE